MTVTSGAPGPGAAQIADYVGAGLHPASTFQAELTFVLAKAHGNGMTTALCLASYRQLRF